MMAGQIKEPVTISFSFQAESVHSGSISFGRFAHEPLLWERRSSFSHNRIQEEVARCSKHRIVTEKKAYFEAQFKKKALLRQCSLDEQTGKQFGAGEQEYEYPHMRSHKDINDLSQGNNNDASSESSIYRGFKEDFDYEEEAQVNVHFDESSDASNDFDEAMEYHIEGREILISEPVMLASSDSVEVKAKVDAGTATAADSQTVIDCTYSRCSSAEHDLEVEKNIDAHVSFVEEDCKAIDLSAGCWKSDKEPDAVSIHSVVCPKIVVAIEPSGTESNGKVARTQRDSLCKAAKVSSSSFKMLEKPRVLEAKTSKQSNLSPSPANKMMRSPYPEHLSAKSTSSISKTMSGRNSGIKELRVAKVAKSPVTTVIKDVPKTLQSPNRTKKVTAPKISSLKTCPTSLQLRSGMRADKRKEMPSRVGQAQASHIQKPVINRTRARTQDKTLDEIKQVRRSSSIKPKPMQSLHSKDEKLESEKKDAIERTPQMKPSNPRTKVLTRSSVNKKTEEGPLNSLSQVSTRTSYPATRSSAVSSLIDKSTRPSSIKDAVSTIRVTGNDKLKNKTAQPKVDAMKGRETISKISPTTGDITTKRTVRKLIDKPRDPRNASFEQQRLEYVK